MSYVTLTYTNWTKGKLAKGTEVLTDLNDILAVVNGGLDMTNFKTSGTGIGISPAIHGDLSTYSTSVFHAAGSITISDTGNKFSSTVVETALQELASYTGKGSSSTTTGGLTYITKFSVANPTFGIAASFASSTITLTAEQTDGLKGVVVVSETYVQGAASEIAFVGGGIFHAHLAVSVNSSTIYPVGTVEPSFLLTSIGEHTNIGGGIITRTDEWNFAGHSFSAGTTLAVAASPWYTFNTNVSSTSSTHLNIVIYGYK